jgi:hypothetical protein
MQPQMTTTMNHGVSRRRIAVPGALLALAFAQFACAATETSRGPIVVWSAEDQWVRIESQDDPAATPNDHPASLSPSSVENALGALRVRLVDRDNGTETQRAVFTKDELANLAPQVAAGLAKAGPRQDVTFTTIGSHALSTGGLIKDPGVNVGRVFYEGGRLNVIFGELQSNYRKKNVYGQRDQDFDKRRQGTRVKASKQKLTLATLPGISLHASGDGNVRDDWVTIDPAVADVPPSAQQEAAKSAAAPTAATPAASQKTSADLEKRLQSLKDLRDKGLISQEAYDAKVRELLSEL